jgi:phosphoribosylformylglycinamidine synthase
MITLRAMMPDVRKIVTPDIKRPGESTLLLIDLGLGKNRMGGSILAQCYNQLGDDCPDIEPDLLKRAFNAIQQLVYQNMILAYHDRSDGGVIVTLLEMAFAGNCGLWLNFKSQNLMRTLFSEESGAVIEVAIKKAREVSEMLKWFGVPVEPIGMSGNNGKVQISFHDHSTTDSKTVFSQSMVSLRQVWRETSYQLKRLQINPDCALAEKKNTRVRSGISYVLPAGFDGKARFTIRRTKNQPKVAILREIGTNSEAEMVASFMMAGFKTVDVAMKDLEKGTVKNLNQFSVMAVCGGFSNGDVLGSARGWAAKILHNEKLFRIFWEFMKRNDTLSYWVCNGAQLAGQLGWLPYLPEDGRPVKGHPVFTYNTSRKFEARWVTGAIEPSPSIMLRGLEGSELGIHVAHGEGRFFCKDSTLLKRIVKEKLAPVRFVNDNGNITEKYPFNPNGSPMGITGLTTPCGRHTMMMPHAERSVQMRQWQYVPEHLKHMENTPWLRAFENMRNWYR